MNQEFTAADKAHHQRLIDELEAAGHIVVRPFSRNDGVSLDSDGSENMKILMVIDFEASGKDPAKDIPVEIGFVRVEFNSLTGSLGRVVERYTGLEDPGFELSEEVQKITGLNRSMLMNQHFDDAHIRQAVQSCDLIVAHNASYDRVLGELRFPELADKPWGCTFKEGPWELMGIKTRSQDYLAYKVARIHYGAHRAMADCEALLEIMRSPAQDGRTCFAHVLESSRKPTFTVWAQNAPFDKKDILRNDGGYRWSGEDAGKVPKTWFKEGVTDLVAAFEFLTENVYGFPASVTVDTVMAMERHSQRSSNRNRVMLNDASIKKMNQDPVPESEFVKNSEPSASQVPVRAANRFHFRGG